MLVYQRVNGAFNKQMCLQLSIQLCRTIHSMCVCWSFACFLHALKQVVLLKFYPLSTPQFNHRATSKTKGTSTFLSYPMFMRMVNCRQIYQSHGSYVWSSYRPPTSLSLSSVLSSHGRFWVIPSDQTPDCATMDAEALDVGSLRLMRVTPTWWIIPQFWPPKMQVWFRWCSFSKGWFSGSMLVFWGQYTWRIEPHDLDTWLITMMIVSSLRIGLWDPFQTHRIHVWYIYLHLP